MIDVNKRRYLEFADTIPYSPNINKFSFGSFMKSVGKDVWTDIKKDKAGTAIAITNSIAEGLNGIAQYNQLNWKLKQAEKMQDLKRRQLGISAMDAFNSAIQLNKALRVLEAQLITLYPLVSTTPNNGFMMPSDTDVINNQYALGGIAKAAVGAVSKVLGSAGNLIENGYKSGVGTVMKAVPIVGGLLGGIANRIFGTKVDEAELQRVNADMANMNNAALAASSANSFDSSALLSQGAVNLNGKIYSGFKSARKNSALNAQLARALDTARRAIANSVDSLKANQTNDALANYSAYGGAIDYAFKNDYLTNGYIRALNEDNGNTLIGNYTDNIDKNQYAEGGKFKKNRTYEISDEEYLKLLDEGYEVQIIN